MAGLVGRVTGELSRLGRRLGEAMGRPRRPTMSARARFEQRAAAVRQRPQRVLAGVLAVVALLGFGGWLWFGSTVFAVQQVQVLGVSGADLEEISAAAAVPLGSPTARVDLGAIDARVRRVGFVRDVQVSRALPHTIVLAVTPRVALFAVRDPEGRLGLVDAEAQVFRQVDQLPAGIALVNGESASPAPEGLRAVITVLRMLPEAQRATVSQITVTSASLVTFTLGSVHVVWGGPGQEQKKLAILQALMATKPAVVDVSAPDTPVTR